MDHSTSTAWELIEQAAGGSPQSQHEFVTRYEPLIRATLTRRWAGRPLQDYVGDAIQEVFVACLRPRGPLDRIDPETGGLRPYLCGLVRNIARQFEMRVSRRRRTDQAELDSNLADQAQHTPSMVLGQRESRAILKHAAQRMEARALHLGGSAPSRVRILRLRFTDGLSVIAIASRLGRDPSWVHHQYAKARQEFRSCLLDLLRQRAGSQGDGLETQCRSILRQLGDH